MNLFSEVKSEMKLCLVFLISCLCASELFFVYLRSACYIKPLDINLKTKQ